MDQSNPKNYQQNEHEYFESNEKYFENSSGSINEKFYAFSRFVPRQALSYFLVRNTIFKQILDVHGSILDFGVYRGGSFFTWQQLSSIYEPYNHIRKVIGFDSFEGFSALGPADQNNDGAEGSDLTLKTPGGMAYDGEKELISGIELLDKNRPIGHVDKGMLVKGLLPESLDTFLESHQETIVSLANFGLGLYEPTLKILKSIKPRLVKGSILVFEDLNQSTWPGETKAFFEVFGKETYALHRDPICPHISWVIIE